MDPFPEMLLSISYPLVLMEAFLSESLKALLDKEVYPSGMKVEYTITELTKTLTPR